MSNRVKLRNNDGIIV